MPKVKILEEKCDGYERQYKLEILDLNIVVYTYGVDHENYSEKSYDDINIGNIKNCVFSIEWVTEIKEDDFESDELTHSIKNSSHVDCQMTVSEVINLDSFECFDDVLGRITVELEHDVDFIQEGMKVIFSGNLRVCFE